MNQEARERANELHEEGCRLQEEARQTGDWSKVYAFYKEKDWAICAGALHDHPAPSPQHPVGYVVGEPDPAVAAWGEAVRDRSSEGEGEDEAERLEVVTVPKFDRLMIGAGAFITLINLILLIIIIIIK